MFLHQTPGLLTKLFPDILWQKETTGKEIFLTFDDGPVPEATTWVLDTLREFEAKATFFMVGDNIVRYKDMIPAVRSSGHTIGNHTFNHLNGWQTSTNKYIENINLADKALGEKQQYFRPPYGRLRRSQYNQLKKSYTLVMWDVLSGDFSKSLSDEECLQQSINSTKPGSIIVFHDSIKAIKKLKQVLPYYLEYFSKAGYSFKPL